jgi:hypothetical protein
VVARTITQINAMIATDQDFRRIDEFNLWNIS